jgi:hypothetical protein
VPRAEENSECTQESDDEFGHELTVVTWRNAGSAGHVEGALKPLISLCDGVLSTDRSNG